MPQEFKIPTPLDSNADPRFVKAAALTAGQAVVFRRAEKLTGQTTAQFQVSPTRTESFDVTSMLGTPVYDQVQIQEGQFFELEDVNGQNPIEYEGIVMQNILVDVSMTKNIIKTPIQGLNGTIKEFVSMGDYVVNMTGNIIGVTNGNTVNSIGQVFPRVDTERLIEICKAPQSLTITSGFLQLFGINEIVITGFKFAQKEGSRDTQPFQITALSDQPINLDEV